MQGSGNRGHPAEESNMSRTLKIVIADDEADLRDYFQETLSVWDMRSLVLRRRGENWSNRHMQHSRT